MVAKKEVLSSQLCEDSISTSEIMDFHILESYRKIPKLGIEDHKHFKILTLK